MNPVQKTAARPDASIRRSQKLSMVTEWGSVEMALLLLTACSLGDTAWGIQMAQAMTDPPQLAVAVAIQFLETG